MTRPRLTGSAPLSRRAVLRAAGVALSLPLLESLPRRLARASEEAAPGGAGAVGDGGQPRRMVCVMVNTGLIPANFFPKETGEGYAPSPYLEPFGDLRRQLTVFSGVSHPDVTGGHCGEQVFLSGAR
ncbi:MAG: hypothetical protein RLZZ111_838, partial [Planctomycetota bacterium]